MKKENVDQHPIVLFDGYCHLCSGSVQFIIKRDPGACFRFASLQSEKGKAVFENAEISSGETDSVILVEKGRVYTRSAAALRIARRLTCGWSLLSVFILVPAFIRDVVYDWIARNRYRWFGKRETCFLPDPDEAYRFLE